MKNKKLYLILLLALIIVIAVILLIVGFNRNVKFSYSSIKNEKDFVFPIDSAKEAVIYSNNLDEFTNFRNSFKNTEDWAIEANYITEKKQNQQYEDWYNSGKILKAEYDERLNWSKTQGDYWHLTWSSNNNAFCIIQFRDTGQLKNITGVGSNNQSFYCGYEGK